MRSIVVYSGLGADRSEQSDTGRSARGPRERLSTPAQAALQNLARTSASRGRTGGRRAAGVEQRRTRSSARKQLNSRTRTISPGGVDAAWTPNGQGRPGEVQGALKLDSKATGTDRDQSIAGGILRMAWRTPRSACGVSGAHRRRQRTKTSSDPPRIASNCEIVSDGTIDEASPCTSAGRPRCCRPCRPW